MNNGREINIVIMKMAAKASMAKYHIGDNEEK